MDTEASHSGASIPSRLWPAPDGTAGHKVAGTRDGMDAPE
jgi:hypothetical protein